MDLKTFVLQHLLDRHNFASVDFSGLEYHPKATIADHLIG